jgi:hypothetical protein
MATRRRAFIPSRAHIFQFQRIQCRPRPLRVFASNFDNVFQSELAYQGGTIHESKTQQTTTLQIEFRQFEHSQAVCLGIA